MTPLEFLHEVVEVFAVLHQRMGYTADYLATPPETH
jgi:hypothetical protein